MKHRHGGWHEHDHDSDSADHWHVVGGSDVRAVVREVIPTLAHWPAGPVVGPGWDQTREPHSEWCPPCKLLRAAYYPGSHDGNRLATPDRADPDEHLRGCPLFTHPTQRGPDHPTDCRCDALATPDRADTPKGDNDALGHPTTTGAAPTGDAPMERMGTGHHGEAGEVATPDRADLSPETKRLLDEWPAEGVIVTPEQIRIIVADAHGCVHVSKEWQDDAVAGVGYAQSATPDRAEAERAADGETK